MLYLKTSVWMIRAESNLANRADLTEILNYRAAQAVPSYVLTYLAGIRLIRQGLHLAMQVSDLFRSSIYLHASFDVVLQKKYRSGDLVLISPYASCRYIRAHCQCVEMLKAIQFTFHRRSAMIGESISCVDLDRSPFVLVR